ncbi:MAG: toxin-antitoxin system HicB family antitoxin [Verrucomicrobia bacterium]|nr:toxin-antitoxin system HicB family antitoxin [Verrucomicrobiota bacterium]
MTIKTRIDPEVHEAAKIAAAKEGLSLTEYLRRLVQEDLDARNLAQGGNFVSNQGNSNATSDSDRIR